MLDGRPPPLPAGEGFLGAGWAPGSGFGTNNRSPNAPAPQGPGILRAAAPLTQPPAPGSGRGTRAPAAAAHVARRAPGPGGGGLPAAAAWQLGSSPPYSHSKSQWWGLFPGLPLHQAVQSSIRRAGGHPCSPALTVWIHAGCWQPPPRSPHLPHGAGSGEPFGVQCMCISWGSSGMGMLAEIPANVGFFPWLLPPICKRALGGG